MKKNQIIILAVVIIVVLIGLISWSLTQQPATTPREEVVEEEEEEVLAEVFSMSAIVLSADAANNFITVKPTNQEEEVKVLIAETTKLIKLEMPFDPANPPAGGSFTPIQTEIEISDFQQGDSIFIKAKENIAGKTTISNIDFIHILP